MHWSFQKGFIRETLCTRNMLDTNTADMIRATSQFLTKTRHRGEIQKACFCRPFGTFAQTVKVTYWFSKWCVSRFFRSISKPKQPCKQLGFKHQTLLISSRWSYRIIGTALVAVHSIYTFFICHLVIVRWLTYLNVVWNCNAWFFFCFEKSQTKAARKKDEDLPLRKDQALIDTVDTRNVMSNCGPQPFYTMLPVQRV